jgi:hypothetical protein
MSIQQLDSSLQFGFEYAIIGRKKFKYYQKMKKISTILNLGRVSFFDILQDKYPLNYISYSFE